MKLRLGTLGRLLREARPYGWPIAGIFVLQMLATPIALLTPIPLKVVIDSFLGDIALPSWLAWVAPSSEPGSAAMLVVAVGLVVTIALLSRAQSLAAWLLDTVTAQRLILGFRVRLFRHAQRLSLTRHDSKGSSDTSYRILYDAPSLRHVIIGALIPLCASVFKFVGMLVVIAALSWQLALVAVLVSPILFGLTRYFGPLLRKRWIRVKELDSSALQIVQQTLSSIRVVKAFGREDLEEQRFEDTAGQGLTENVKVAWTEGIYGLLVGLTLATGTASVLWLGAGYVHEGHMSLGDLIYVMALLGGLYDPLKSMGKQLTKMQGSLASADRAFALLDEEPEVVESPEAQPLTRVRGSFEIRDLAFAYGGDDDGDVFSNVSLSIPAGARVGIQGRTGAGKTTFLNLLMRFFDPKRGSIELDGKDLRSLKLDDLRRQFAIVLQDPVLFASSIAENIAYARPGATIEEIRAAAELADADDFIRSMPDGYDTQVGERGMRLSGGERQRISLARAFLKDAPILILDEPTSSVDVGTESRIMGAIERLMEGRTTFVVAHRLSTLDHCDIRLRVDGGRIEQSTRAAALETGHRGLA